MSEGDTQVPLVGPGTGVPLIVNPLRLDILVCVP